MVQLDKEDLFHAVVSAEDAKVELTYDKLKNLMNIFGESFYLLDVLSFETNYSNLLEAFRRYYPSTQISYSYKTNYLPCLCEKINLLGGYAEIVSEMEMWLAFKVGVNGDHIFYNGPYKKKRYIEDLMLKGGHVNVDGMYELEYIKEIAASHPDQRFEVGVRCMADIGQADQSRFGFDLASGEFQQAYECLNGISNVEIVGLHLHLPFRDLESYKKRMFFLDKVLDLYPKHKWKYISVGGGYIGIIPKEMSSQFGFEVPSFDEYAMVIAKHMKERYGDSEIQPCLIIEPGSALVANAMSYVTKVVNVKQSRNGYIATLSGSTFQMNPSIKSVKRPMTVLANKSQRYYDKIDLAGYTCIESDYLFKDFSGEIGVEDIVVFHNVGSYSIVMKPPFILPDIPVIEITEQGYRSVAREQYAPDVFARFFED